MKKKLFLTVLTTLFLTGCVAKNNSSFIDNGTPPIDNGGNNDNGNYNNSNQNGNNENNNSNQDCTGYKVTFQTWGATFENAITLRSQFGGESNNANNVTKLKEYFMTGVEHDDILDSLTFDGYVQTLEAGEKDNLNMYLCLGSGSSEGAMTWTSTRKILKVEVTVINYYKTYTAYVEGQAVDGLSSDSMVHFKIDDSDNSLELIESLIPEQKTFSQTYGENGTNSFSFASVGGRVLIKSFSVTWKF